VSGVRLTAAGSPFVVPGVGSPPGGTDLGYSDDVRVAGEPLVLTGGRLQRMAAGSGELAPITGGSPAGAASGAGLRTVSAGLGGTPLVAVDAAGGALLRLGTGGRRDLLLSAAQLVDPVVDPTERVWTADRSVPGRLVVVDVAADGAPSSGLLPTWLHARTVEAVDLSRDGTRVAVVSSQGGRRRVDVAGVVRDRAGRPLRLSSTSLPVAQSLDDVRDVAWADRGTLVVLARRGTGALRPYSASVGGVATALPDVRGAVSVAAGDGLRAVYLTTASGQVLARSGSGWRLLGAGSAVTVPG
jgi:hypothetical protein